jgi:hypothetical protein
MAKKKPTRKKKSVSKRKPALKKKPTAKKKPAAKKKATLKKKALAKKKAAKKKASKKKGAGRRTTRRATSDASRVNLGNRRGMGADSGGQSGDTQGLSRQEHSDSESVEELLEEGQYAEAEAVSGVENARDPDEGEVTTSEFPEDDVPEEYRDQD